MIAYSKQMATARHFAACLSNLAPDFLPISLVFTHIVAFQVNPFVFINIVGASRDSKISPFVFINIVGAIGILTSFLSPRFHSACLSDPSFFIFRSRLVIRHACRRPESSKRSMSSAVESDGAIRASRS